jgi:peptide/nickel transport system permease protein
MLRFMGRRILFIITVYVLIVFFAHLGMSMIRNSEVSRPNYDVVQQGRRAWQDTRSFLSGVLRGQWGTVRTDRGTAAVKDVLRKTYVNSMGLLLVALVSATLIGLCVGGVAALIRREHLALLLLTLTILGISTPSFFAGLLLQVGELRYLATFGRRLVSMAGFGWDVEHMLMPALVLAARPVAYLTRATFIALRHTMQEDYIRTAFSKGLSLRQSVTGHALRNVAVPVLTAIGVSVRFSLSTLPVVELFFAWPGMGQRLLEAIDGRQTSMVVALASALGLTLLGVNLALDIIYRMVDPRMREGE